MDIKLRVALVVVTLMSVGLVVRISRKARMEARDATNWFIVCLVLLMAALFPGGVDWFARMIGISVASNAAFAITLFALLCIVFYLNIRISRLSLQNRTLVQKIGILERELRDAGFLNH